MPASRSPSRATEARRPVRLWPMALIGLVLLLAAVVYVLPASLVAHFLPPQVRADDFSGSFLHGAAGKLSVNARDAGAIEWQLRPLALLRAQVAADIHWVKVGFVIDANAAVDRHSFVARDIHGGGPMENLRDLGMAAGWHGTVTLNFVELKSDFSKLNSAVGTIEVADLSSARIAAGADLGSYQLQLAAGAVTADGNIGANLRDTGGPIEVQAQIQFSPAARSGVLSGTLKERPDASPALHSQLDSLAQIRPRDPQGRIPVELEFTF
jgi:general secretion pathway protein N